MLGEIVETLTFFAKFSYEAMLTNPGPFFTEKDYPDLTGQKWLVTGATGGIGLDVSKLLLGQGAEVWLVGRSQTKLDSATKTLQQQFPSGKIRYIIIDYTDLRSVKPAVEQLRGEVDHLNGIIHNAGVMFVPKGSVTKQGYEETIGVNNLATSLLQDLLDPLIENVPNGRIVWLSSVGHVASPKNGFNPELVGKTSAQGSYFMSKALDYISAVQWTKKHPNSPVKSVAVHPGAIKSDLARHMSSFERTITAPIHWDTIYGARTVVVGALDPKIANNVYVIPFGRPGLVRPDVYETAHGERGIEAVAWIESKIAPFK